MDIWRAVASADAGKFSAEVQAAPADFDINARAQFEVSEFVPYASTLLIEAISKGSIECVAAVISAGADANVASGIGDTPLVAACRTGHVAIVQSLLSAGADANRTQQAPAGAPHSPLSAIALSAAEHGAVATAAIVDALVAAGADVDTPYGPGGLRPLHILARAGDVALPAVRALLQAGADANQPTAAEGKGFTPLQWAVLSDAPGVTDMVQLLLQHGASPNVDQELTKVLEPPLLSAAAAFQGGAFQALLAAGGKVTHKSLTRHSVLDFACRALTAPEQEQGLHIIRCILGHPKAAEVLAMKGPSGKTPLLTAVRAGFADAVHELLSAGLPGTELSEGGEPLLVVAADAQSPGVLEALLVHGADVHAKVGKNARETALLAAARCPLVPTAERARGTVFGGVPTSGAAAAEGKAGDPAPVQSAFGDLWVESEDAGQLMVRMLLAAGANASVVCAFGGTALHRAALGGNHVIARVLLEHARETGTRVALTQDGVKRTAADVAVQQGSHHTLQLLLEHPATREAVLEQGRGLATQAFGRRNWRVLMALLIRPEVGPLGTHPALCDVDMKLPEWAVEALSHPYQLNYEGASWCTFLTLLAHRSPLVAPFTGAVGVRMCSASLLQGAPLAEPEHEAEQEAGRAPARSWWVPAFVGGLFGTGGGGAAVAPAGGSGGQRRRPQAGDLSTAGLWCWEDGAARGADKRRLLSKVGAQRVLRWLAVFPSGFTTDTAKWQEDDAARDVSLMALALVLALDRRHRLRAKAAAAADPNMEVPGGVLDALTHANWRLRRTLLLCRVSHGSEAKASD